MSDAVHKMPTPANAERECDGVPPAAAAALTRRAAVSSRKQAAAMEEDDEEAELRRLQAEMAM